MEDQKTSYALYQQYVTEGRRLVQKIETYQLELSILATKVCEIRHGGISNNIYTMKRFAEDIGLHPKTLSNWVAIYRHVIKKGDIKVESKQDWEKARRVHDKLKEERVNINREAGKPGTRHAYKKDVPKDKILKLYSEIDEKPFVNEVTRAIQSAKHIKYLMSTRDLSIVESARLSELMELLDQSSDIINDYLTAQWAKGKRNGRDQVKAGTQMSSLR